MHTFAKYPLLLSLLLVSLAAREAYSQTGCPFPDSVAVADTLDPKGYYPLQVGNVWEYVNETYGFLQSLERQEIVADTLLQGMTFFRLKSTRFQPIDSRIGGFRVRIDQEYLAVTDSSLVTVRLNSDDLLPREIRFDYPFTACYVTDDYDPDGTLVIVEGGPDQTFEIEENGEDTEVDLAAVKHFIFFAPGASFGDRYGYGMGVIDRGGEGGAETTLVYARIGDQTIGTRIDSLYHISLVSAEASPEAPATSFLLSNYPNPFLEQTSFTFTIPVSGEVTLEVTDLLGRVVARPISNKWYAPGLQVVPWQAKILPPGVYLAKLVLDKSIKGTHKLVLIH